MLYVNDVCGRCVSVVYVLCRSVVWELFAGILCAYCVCVLFDGIVYGCCV